MGNRGATSIRDVLEFLVQQNRLLVAKAEVDPIYEIAGILKGLEGGAAVLFECVKGYPGVRCLGNLFADGEMAAAMFGLDNPEQIKFTFLEAIKKAIPPKVVETGPCQEVVITNDIDVMATLPIIKHTEADAGRILAGGVILARDNSYTEGGSDLAFKRMHFRGKNWGSIAIAKTSHLGVARGIEHRDERIPLTINIAAPPAVMMVAATIKLHAIVPYGFDELGIAGAFQGSPVEICQAKTVDAYAIANSEWVIEGYCLPERVWETEEAEKVGKSRVAPLFPEWSGYLGKALFANKFEVTAITHREDRPVFYVPLAHSYEHENMGGPLKEACLYELAQRIRPGLVIDVHLLHAFNTAGVVFQVKKGTRADEGWQKNILEAALVHSLVRMAIAVDEDVDIYSADDVLWAILTRGTHESAIFRRPRNSIGVGMIPSQEIAEAKRLGYSGAIGIDATLPFAERGQFQRAKYPVDRVHLGKWFSEHQLATARLAQDEYARLLAERGY